MKQTPDIVFVETSTPDIWEVIFKFPGTMHILKTVRVSGDDINMPFIVGLTQLEIAKEISIDVTQLLLDDIMAYKYMLKASRDEKTRYLKEKKLNSRMPPSQILSKIRKK